MESAVFLSASIPDPKRHPEFARTADSVAILSAVSALLYVTLGRRPLVWGGHPAITPMVVEVYDSMGVDYGEWVRLYQSKFFVDQYPEENERFQNTVFTDEAKDGSRESSLEHMRLRMLGENSFIAGVFVGGMQGVIDEAALFTKVQPDAKLIPIASTGGAALLLANQMSDLPVWLRTDLEYVGLFHRALGIGQGETRYQNREGKSVGQYLL